MLGMLAGIAGQALGAGMGYISQKLGNKMQLKQAQKMQDMQIQGQQQMADYNQGLALDMWNKTNAEAQRKQYEKAGLNVGLMYGGGGPGAQATVTPGNVGGQQASANSGMGIDPKAITDMALQAAQIKLMEAQAKKTDVETAKTAGVDTEEAQTRIANLKASTANTEMQTKIGEYEKNLRKIESEVAGATQEDIIGKVRKEYEVLANQAKILDGTNGELVKQAKITTQKMGIEMLLQKALIEQTGATTALTKEQTALTSKMADKLMAEITRMEEQTKQGWQQLDQQKQEIAIKKALQDFATSTPADIKQWTDVVNGVTKSIKELADTFR